MAEYMTVQQAVLGELLPDIGAKSRAMAKDVNLRPHAGGGSKKGAAGGLIKNSVWTPQSVVKRVQTGACHNAKSLRRQMEYIIRDEANMASWTNQIGIERSFDEDGVDSVVGDWSSSWVGAPKRGHTDHIILSFPKGTDAETAQAIAREWGEDMFGSGNYEDRFRYVAALHHNTEHVHAHFIVDKVGMDHGNFLSIGKFSEINYDTMRQRHADIAETHGLALNATSRFSRGLIENPARQSDIQAAKREDREPHVEPLSFIERAKREAIMRGHGAEYRVIENMAKMNLADDPEGFWSRVMDGAQVATGRLLEGQPIMSEYADVNDVPSGSVDPAGRLIAAREALMAEAQSTWQSIQEMEPSADKVELEQQFADHSRTTMRVMGEDDFLKSHVTSVEDGKDPYSVSAIAGLADRASDVDNKYHAQADSAVADFRDGLEKAFTPFEQQFEAAGTNSEEVAARFAASYRTEAQLEATRPDDPTERAAWMQLEQSLQIEAEKVAATLPVGRELQEDLAREQLLEAKSTDRLADIAALDKLVTEVRADLSDGDMDRVANGQLDPLMDQIRDPGVRQAVSSELKNVAAVEEDGRDVSGRDSEPASTYRELTLGHERAAERANDRSRDREDHEIEL